MIKCCLILILVVFVMLLPFILYFVLKYRHSPFTPLTDEIKKEIEAYGLVHYTSSSGKSSIELDKAMKPGDSLKGKKKRCALYPSEEGLIWFYSGKITFSQLDDKSKRILKEKKCKYAIKFVNLRSDDIEKITYRKKDKALVYKGTIPLKRLIIEKI